MVDGNQEGKEVMVRNNKEADQELKNTIMAFGDVTDKCFKYATEE